MANVTLAFDEVEGLERLRVVRLWRAGAGAGWEG